MPRRSPLPRPTSPASRPINISPRSRWGSPRPPPISPRSSTIMLPRPLPTRSRHSSGQERACRARGASSGRSPRPSRAPRFRQSSPPFRKCSLATGPASPMIRGCSPGSAHCGRRATCSGSTRPSSVCSTTVIAASSMAGRRWMAPARRALPPFPKSSPRCPPSMARMSSPRPPNGNCYSTPPISPGCLTRCAPPPPAGPKRAATRHAASSPSTAAMPRGC